MERTALEQAEEVGEAAHAVDAVGEDERAAGVLAHEVVEVGVLVDERAEDLRLGEVVGGDRLGRQVEHERLAAHVNLVDERVEQLLLLALQLLVALGGRGRLVLERAGEACNERGREQEVLTLAGRLLVAVHQREYLLHLAEVAFLDHAVRLVDNQIAYPVQSVQVLVALLLFSLSNSPNS